MQYERGETEIGARTMDLCTLTHGLMRDTYTQIHAFGDDQPMPYALTEAYSLLRKASALLLDAAIYLSVYEQKE